MKVIRIKAFLIDFLVLLLALTIINLIIPKSDYLNMLEIEQNSIMEAYMSGRIGFDSYVSNYGNLYYEGMLEQQLNYSLYFIFMLMYFVIIPFIYKGRTLGCYLCHVQIERFDQGKLYMWQLLVRYSIVFGISYIFLSNVLLLILPSKYYFSVVSILAIFQFVLSFFSAATVIFRKEKRGLHELLSNTEITKIIEVKKRSEKKWKKKIMKKKTQVKSYSSIFMMF